MPYSADRAASRYGRDRDLLPAVPRLGPYELRYDVLRGYEQVPMRPSGDASRPDVLLFRTREDEGRTD